VLRTYDTTVYDPWVTRLESRVTSNVADQGFSDDSVRPPVWGGRYLSKNQISA
jgi:hypothetical protein